VEAAEQEGRDPTEPRSGSDTTRRRLHPVISGLATTLAGQVLVALGTVLLYRLIAQRAGTDGFASFSLAKQFVNLLFPVVTVGLVGGLPRSIALARGKPDMPGEDSLLAAAAGICAAAAGIAAAIAIAFPDVAAEVFFGGEASRSLVASAAALLVATTAFYVAYGYFRGRLQLVTANGLQVVGVGIVPPAILLAVHGLSIPDLIALMALGLAIASLGPIAVPLFRGLVRGGSRQIRAATRSLLDYGGRRVPGEMAQVGLFALVPVLASHVTSLTNVAYLAASLQVVAMLVVALNPIGIVLLPSIAERWEVDPQGTSEHVGILAGFATHAAIFSVCQLLPLGGIALVAWLGSSFEDAEALVRVTLLGVGPFVFYLTMRSSLDAVAVRSYNTRSNLAGLFAFIVVASTLLGFDLCDPAFAVAWAFASGVLVQGTMTLVFVRMAFRVPLAAYALGPALGLGAVSGLLALAARPLIEDSSVPVLMLLAVELVLGVAYVAGLAAARAGWIRLLRERGAR
jgi:O-antigen/teichoic acid export membrane protein